MRRRFEDQVDPDHVLNPIERARRAENARKAHMADLSRRAVLARQKKSGRDGGDRPRNTS